MGTSGELGPRGKIRGCLLVGWRDRGQMGKLQEVREGEGRGGGANEVVGAAKFSPAGYLSEMVT